MKDKHEQLYVAVQDLLIELGITPKRLKLIVTDKNCITDCAASRVSAETAQKLIDANLIVEETNWKLPDNISGPHQKTDKTNVSISDQGLPKSENLDLSTFNAIKSRLLPGIFWKYLQKAHSKFLQIQVTKLQTDEWSEKDYPLTTFSKIKSHLAPIILWEYLQEEHPEFLFEEIKDYLFPSG